MKPARQLYWVQRNRQWKDRAVPAAAWAEAMAADLMNQGPGNEVIACIESVVDQAFVENCRIDAGARGSLSIMVADAALVSWIKRNWETRLLTALRPHGVRRLSFAFGQSGRQIGAGRENT